MSYVIPVISVDQSQQVYSITIDSLNIKMERAKELDMYSATNIYIYV